VAPRDRMVISFLCFAHTRLMQDLIAFKLSIKKRTYIRGYTPVPSLKLYNTYTIHYYHPENFPLLLNPLCFIPVYRFSSNTIRSQNFSPKNSPYELLTHKTTDKLSLKSEIAGQTKQDRK
jgi:hypothetical protein